MNRHVFAPPDHPQKICSSHRVGRGARGRAFAGTVVGPQPAGTGIEQRQKQQTANWTARGERDRLRQEQKRRAAGIPPRGAQEALDEAKGYRDEFGRLTPIPDKNRPSLGRISDGDRPDLGRFPDNSRTQNELTSLEVRRAVWNGSCYGCPLHWQGEQRPPSNQITFRRRCTTSPAQPGGVFTGGI